MRHSHLLLSMAFASASLLLTAETSAQSGERLSDKDVVQIIEAVDHGRDRFEDQLDGKVKNSTLRGPRGEVNVERYLQDLQDNVKKLKERFNKNYSAGAEAVAVLRQGSDVDNYLKAQSAEIKGRSEWDRLAVDLGRLAQAYNAPFPLPADAPVRRLNDGETAATAEAIGKQADVVRKAIEQNKALAPADKEAFKRDLEQLKEQAKTVKERVSDSKPATAEARQLLATVNKIDNSFKSKAPGAPTLSAWGAMRASLEKIQQAFRIQT